MSRHVHAALVVDADSGARSSLARRLRQHGFVVHAVRGALEAARVIERERLCIVLASFSARPACDGIAALQTAKLRQPECHRVLVSVDTKGRVTQIAGATGVAQETLEAPVGPSALLPRLMNAH